MDIISVTNCSEFDAASFSKDSSASLTHQWVLTAMQKHGEGLMRMLWRILGNESDACDAYQEVFLKLARKTDMPKPKNVKAFVFKSAANVAVSMLRQRKIHIKACREIALGKEETINQVIPDIDRQAECDALRENIAKLPDKLQQIIMLRDLAELPYSQIAKIMGVSPESARVYRCRALKQLSVMMSRGRCDK